MYCLEKPAASALLPEQSGSLYCMRGTHKGPTICWSEASSPQWTHSKLGHEIKAGNGAQDMVGFGTSAVSFYTRFEEPLPSGLAHNSVAQQKEKRLLEKEKKQPSWRYNRCLRRSPPIFSSPHENIGGHDINPNQPKKSRAYYSCTSVVQCDMLEFIAAIDVWLTKRQVPPYASFGCWQHLRVSLSFPSTGIQAFLPTSV